MFKEGNIITVKIIGETTTPKGEEVFIVIHLNHKFLLSKETFTKTQPQIGQFVECIVDKVNCSGKIFLQAIKSITPIGTIEKFSVLHKNIVHDSLSQKKYQYSLLSNNGLRIHLISYSDTSSNIIKCKITGQNKSKLIIESLIPGITNYHFEQVLSFKIIKTNDVDNIGLCYIVEDLFKRKHIISIAKYAHYNLNLGQNIQCRLLGFDKRFNLKLEPVNPIYEIGKQYIFETIRIEESKDDLGNNIRLLVVKDQLGMEASIVQLPNQITINDSITAYVYRINNGRLYLSLDI